MPLKLSLSDEMVATNESKAARLRENAGAVESSTEHDHEQLQISEPHENDVFCGEDWAVNPHPGNKRFRDLMKKREHAYIVARFKREKHVIAERVVKDVKQSNPPGRFLNGIFKHGGPYIEISDELARDKTLGELRENTKSAMSSQQDMNTEGGNGIVNGIEWNYEDIMKNVTEKFECNVTLEDVSDDIEDNEEQLDEFEYVPNEFGLPTVRREEIYERIHQTYTYEPNEFGQRSTRTYEPDQYGNPTPRNFEVPSLNTSLSDDYSDIAHPANE